MDYEKKYKEALERANVAHKNEDRLLKATLERIFPELKESEDERIRKFLIEDIKDTLSSEDFRHYNPEHTKKLEEALAWLEKQGEQKSLDDVAKEVTKNKETAISFLKLCGIMNANGELADEYKIEQDEQKPADSYCQENCKGFQETGKCFADWDCKDKREAESIDKIEPKFKVGDYIVNDYCGGKVIELTNDAYLLDTGQGIPFSCEHNAHLWTIADAKDGDVLVASDSSIFLFKGTIDYACIYYVALTTDDVVKFNEGLEHYWETSTAVHPATKEQCDLLFEKMHEAGYTFGFEKKEMKKIHVIDEGKSEMDYCFTKMMNGEKVTPTWSKDDDNKWIESLIQTFNDGYFEGFNQLKSYGVIDWLKSIKSRVQPKQKCSEEDSIRLQRIIDFLWYNRKGDADTIYQQEQDIDWLKSLKDLNKCSYTFNKIDKEILNAAILFAMNSTDEFACNGVSKEDVIDWLKSLK